MAKPYIDAPLEEYVKCGFSLRTNQNGSIDVIATDTSPEGLAITCSLNIGFWGSKGNFLVDPDEDGFVCHTPVQGQAFTKPATTEYRKFINHGKWFIDIFYGLNPTSLAISKMRLEDAFAISKDQNDVLLIERKFTHKMYQYKWAYRLRVHLNGMASISLRRFPPLRLIPWIKRRLD